ncbi:Glycoside hydrolase [Mycena sanguinolenta]|uniref:Glycoside hydrolase n=1 Tax=Mycena sanguinolenta TaxID=230812 RepID=A0A8H7CXZ2_9AGAR|nr:Glycoside hydrolase [Mycena sanguinolenta]
MTQVVEALVRPSSADRSDVKALEDRGVKIRVADIEGPLEALVGALAGVDVLISAIDLKSQLVQIPLVTATKKAGVKRFVPCAFTTVAPPGGVMVLRDSKEEVYQHIRKSYLPYTIIDVGYWYQISFPTLPSGRVDYASLFKTKTAIHNNGSMPNMFTDLRDIGRFVALIIKDTRTLNKSVFAYGELLSENEVSADEIADARASIAARLKADPTDSSARIDMSREDYHYSKYVRGDNTPAYATYLGYLNARELYPAFKPRTFGDFAQELLDGRLEKPYGQLVFDFA